MKTMDVKEMMSAVGGANAATLGKSVAKCQIKLASELDNGGGQNDECNWTYADSCWDSGIWSCCATNKKLGKCGFGRGYSRSEARSNAVKNALAS